MTREECKKPPKKEKGVEALVKSTQSDNREKVGQRGADLRRGGQYSRKIECILYFFCFCFCF